MATIRTFKEPALQQAHLRLGIPMPMQSHHLVVAMAVAIIQMGQITVQVAAQAEAVKDQALVALETLPLFLPLLFKDIQEEMEAPLVLIMLAAVAVERLLLGLQDQALPEVMAALVNKAHLMRHRMAVLALVELQLQAIFLAVVVVELMLVERVERVERVAAVVAQQLTIMALLEPQTRVVGVAGQVDLVLVQQKTEALAAPVS